MISFEDYILQQTSKHKIKNLRIGDKIKYIGKEIETWGINPNTIFTVLDLIELYDRLFIEVKTSQGNVFFNSKDIIKI